MKTIDSIPLDQIHIPGTNPRKHFDPSRDRELCESVKQHGVLQPVLVRPRLLVDQVKEEKEPRFELVCGERRYRAARAAGLESIPAVARELSDQAAAEVQLVENLQRQDLHPLEEAQGYAKLKEFGYKPEDLAQKIHKSRSYVYGRLILNRLCAKAQKALWEDKLDASRALLIARIHGGDKLQEEALSQINGGWSGPMSYREARDHIHREFMLRLSEAPFDVRDADLPGGPCSACPKRTGNQPELFEDVSCADVCTDPACFHAKRDLSAVRSVEKARQAGKPVLDLKESKEMFSGGFLQSRGYIDLKDRCDSLGYEHDKTWGKTLPKKALPEVILAIDDQGKPHQLLRRSEAQAALKQAGLKAKPGIADLDGRKQEDKARKKRRAEMEKVVKAVEGQIQRLASEPEFWRLLAQGAIDFAGFYRCQEVVQRRGLNEKGKRPGDCLSKALEGLDLAGMAGLLFELLMAMGSVKALRKVLEPISPEPGGNEPMPGHWTERLLKGSFTWNKDNICTNPAALAIPIPKPYFAEIQVAGGKDRWFWGYQVGKKGTGVGCFCAGALPSQEGHPQPSGLAAAGQAVDMILVQLKEDPDAGRVPAKIVRSVQDWRRRHGL